jgi:methionyl-tRNA formyltransferase
MKIACVGYRKWALEIYDSLEKNTDHDFLIIRGRKEYSKEKIHLFNPDLVLFYGWSWKIHEEIYNNYKSIMLHPSDLPKFRGGTPIQNQIISGVLDSKVTLFVINEGYDAGKILIKGDLSLRGHITEIFERITETGTELTLEVLKKQPAGFTQDESEATYYNRRKPEQSEITIEELLNEKSDFLYNKIRMREDPYPNAFIRTIDNRKLLLKFVEIGD